jgi:hypothetical protein
MMSFIRSRYFLFSLIFVFLALVGLGIMWETTWAEPAASLLWLNPAVASAPVGNATVLDLQLSDITNVYGAQMELAFDPTVLEVVGSAVTPGTCPQPDFVVTNTADNVAGTIDYAVTQLNPTPPCDGGVAASIERLCKLEHAGTTVSITSSLISDPDGMSIEHSTQNATVECVGGFVVVGSVSLQSWPSPEGSLVTLRDSGGGIVDQVVVGPDGSFNLISGDIADTYSLEASHDRYLTALASGITGGAGDTINVGNTTLRAGDLNGDGVINILDITIVAGNFGKSSPIPWAP